jgi:ABC-type phosphate transport system substrate-binding protein
MPSSRARFLLPAVLLTTLGFSATSPAEASPDNLVVFVHRGVSIDSLSVEDVRQIFLRKQTSWSSGQRIVCVDALADTATSDAFRKKVLRMSSDELKRYWEEQQIKGELAHIPAFSDTVRAVFMLNGSIGYALRKDLKTDAVKIVLEL